jgi:hypothetical protein
MLKGMVAVVLVLLSLAGCATENWPKRLETNLAQLDSKGIVLATISYYNEWERGRALHPLTLVTGKINEDKKDDVSYIHIPLDNGEDLRVLSKDGKHYLIVLQNDPGTHMFYSVRGNVLGGFLEPAFESPILATFQTKEHEIVYIGSIQLQMRKKKSDSEYSAGPMFPLIDQAGMGGATIDVVIDDDYETDIHNFEEVFPNLKDHTVIKRILPRWKRPSSKKFSPSTW